MIILIVMGVSLPLLLCKSIVVSHMVWFLPTTPNIRGQSSTLLSRQKDQYLPNIDCYYQVCDNNALRHREGQI